VADTVMTARVLHDLAEYWRVLQGEYHTSVGERSVGGVEGVSPLWLPPAAFGSPLSPLLSLLATLGMPRGIDAGVFQWVFFPIP
ncbi:hypothetical protein, partial [Salmonella enterica]|uniref:hypothetical protein n=1 Tax=Salmonella enterica TaxID=28901 RepID=UPI001CB851DA